MTSILITAFDKFGGLDSNPSAEIARSLEADGHIVAVLPTSYTRSSADVERLLLRHQPDVLLMLGYAKGVPLLRLERRATNMVSAVRADNDGFVRQGVIEAGGPQTRESSVDVDDLERQLSLAGFRATLSENAGGYVCNYAYYRALAPGRTCRVIFAHLSRADSEVLDAVRRLVSELSQIDDPGRPTEAHLVA